MYRLEINGENVYLNEEEYSLAIGDVDGAMPFSIRGQFVLVGFKNEMQDIFNNEYNNKICHIFRKCVNDQNITPDLYHRENRNKFKKIVNEIGKKVNKMLETHEKYIDIQNDIYIRLFNRLYKTLNDTSNNFSSRIAIAERV